MTVTGRTYALAWKLSAPDTSGRTERTGKDIAIGICVDIPSGICEYRATIGLEQAIGCFTCRIDGIQFCQRGQSPAADALDDRTAADDLRHLLIVDKLTVSFPDSHFIWREQRGGRAIIGEHVASLIESADGWQFTDISTFFIVFIYSTCRTASALVEVEADGTFTLSCRSGNGAAQCHTHRLGVRAIDAN